MNPIKLIKKLIGVLRGGATPTEVAAAVTLGMLLGFIPFSLSGFLLPVLLIVLLLVMNLSVAVCLLSCLVGKLLAALAAPLTFVIGKTLLDIGPVAAGVGVLANAPITAWMDLDRYCTLGGIPVGIVVGLIAGVLLARSVVVFRKKMAALETGSEKFRNWSKKWYVRLTTRILLGKRKGAKGMAYADVLEKKTRWLRKSGVVVAVVFVALVVLAELLFAGLLVRKGLQWGLERANGATVDIESVELSLLSGSCVVRGLQVCDPRHLDRNRISIAEMRADFGVGAALSRRLVIDELSITDVYTDSRRTTEGERFVELPPTPREQEEDDGKSVFRFLKDRKLWKERLAQLQRYLEARKKAKEQEKEPKREEGVGYRDLRASHLVRESPRLLIRKVVVAGLRVTVGAVKATYDVEATNISTNAALAGANPEIHFVARDKSVKATITLSMIDDTLPNTIDLEARNVDLAAIQKMLSDDNKMRFKGGEIDFVIKKGTFSADELNVPLRVQLRNLKAAGAEKELFGVPGQYAKIAVEALDGLETTIILKGRPLTPYPVFDTAGLLASLKRAAGNVSAAAARAISAQLTKEVDKAKAEVDKVKAKIDKTVDDVKKKLLDKLKGRIPLPF